MMASNSNSNSVPAEKDSIDFQAVEDEGEDDWETGDLPPIPTKERADIVSVRVGNDDGDSCATYDDDSYWNEAPLAISEDQAPSKSVCDQDGRTRIHTNSSVEPMLIVDLTVLSHGAIHSKFDRNSVNDPVAVKQWKKVIEEDYRRYANDSNYLARRIVIPCGSSVWRGALSTLRNDAKGHYFCPIFPPNEDNKK